MPRPISPCFHEALSYSQRRKQTQPTGTLALLVALLVLLFNTPMAHASWEVTSMLVGSVARNYTSTDGSVTINETLGLGSEVRVESVYTPFGQESLDGSGSVIYTFYWSPKNGDYALDPTPSKIRFRYRSSVTVAGLAVAGPHYDPPAASHAQADMRVRIGENNLELHKVADDWPSSPPFTDIQSNTSDWKDVTISTNGQDITLYSVSVQLSVDCSVIPFSID